MPANEEGKKRVAQAQKDLEEGGLTGAAELLVAYRILEELDDPKGRIVRTAIKRYPDGIADAATKDPQYKDRLIAALAAAGVTPDYSKRERELSEAEKAAVKRAGELDGREKESAEVYDRKAAVLSARENILTAKEKLVAAREINLKERNEAEEAKRRAREERDKEYAAAAKGLQSELEELEAEVDGKAGGKK